MTSRLLAEAEHRISHGGLACQLGAVGSGEPKGVFLAHVHALDGDGVARKILHDVVLALTGGGEHPFLRVVAADGQVHQGAALVRAGDGGHADHLRLALRGEHIGNLPRQLVQAGNVDLDIVQGVGAQTGEYGGAAGDLGNLGRAIGIRAGDGEQAVRDLSSVWLPETVMPFTDTR